MFFSECFEMFCLFGRMVRWMGFAVVFRRKIMFCLFGRVVSRSCSGIGGWLAGS